MGYSMQVQTLIALFLGPSINRLRKMARLANLTGNCDVATVYTESSVQPLPTSATSVHVRSSSPQPRLDALKWVNRSGLQSAARVRMQ